MKLRTQALQGIDPSRVPLPNGTEVTTSVSRIVGGQRISQGAVGRVVRSEGEHLLVRIVGVGEVQFQRSELTPCKSGQLDFAIRREVAWQALRPAVTIETVVGSRAWGLADEHSDTDIRGVFVLPFPWTSGLITAPSGLISADGSTHFWEVGKAIRQALRGDPNTLETLLLSGASARNTLGTRLLEVRDAFASSAIYGTFGRYALSQLKRLGQGMRLAEHRSLLLTWLRETPEQSLDQASEKLAKEVSLAELSDADRLLRAKEYIKQLYSSLYDQGLLTERSFASLVDFANAHEHEFSLPRDLRPKNAYNLLRLLATATQWLRTGVPQFEMHGAFRDELLSVKNQQVPLGIILSRADELAAELEEARHHSVLPSEPDIVRADAALRDIREDAARRWFENEESIFGVDCPTPPPPERGNKKA